MLQQVADRIATEAGATVKASGSLLRWEAPGDGSKIRIMRRGSKVAGKSNVVAVISKSGKYADLFPSWQKAIQERDALRTATGSKRVSHKTISAGAIPER